jgi:hypothetical protein
MGQMNNLVYASRELVYDSGENYFEIDKTARQFGPLAKQLLDEAQEGAALVNAESDSLTTIAVNDLNLLIERANAQQGLAGLTLPWCKSEPKSIYNFYIGDLNSQPDSNVMAPSAEGNPRLLESDMRNHLINPKSGRYYGNQTLTLPDDGSLKFKLCCISSGSDKSTRPAALIRAEVFKRSAALMDKGKKNPIVCKYLPSSMLISVAVKLQTSGGHEGKIAADCAGTISDALPPPWRTR